MAFRDAAKSEEEEEEGKVINAVMMHKTRAFFLSSPVHRDPLKRASKRAKMEWGERDNLQEIVMSNCRKIQLQPTRLPFSPISGPTNPSFISSVSTSRVGLAASANVALAATLRGLQFRETELDSDHRDQGVGGLKATMDALWVMIFSGLVITMCGWKKMH